MPNDSLSDTIPRRRNVGSISQKQIELLITVEYPQWDTQLDKINILFEKAASETLKKIDWLPSVEISIVLTNDQAIEKLNATYRQKNAPTNVLSFPAFEADELDDMEEKSAPNLNSMASLAIGDLVFAYETIQHESLQMNKSFENHLMHLFIHGLLHLFGYDHETDNQAEIMENLEIEILRTCGVSNPYEF